MIKEMKRSGKTQGYRRVDLTVAELLRLCAAFEFAVEPYIQRRACAKPEFGKDVIASQILQSVPMTFTLCCVANMMLGQYSLLDGAQRLTALIRFFQGFLTTPEMSNELLGEPMMITNTDKVLLPSTAVDMHNSGDDDQVNMLRELANTVVTVNVHTPHLSAAGRAYLFIKINTSNELSNGERLAGFGGAVADYAREIEENNPFFHLLNENHVSLGVRKTVFYELCKVTSIQLQINAAKKAFGSDLLNCDVLGGDTKPVSQANLEKFAIDNPSDKEITFELKKAFEDVNRKYRFIHDITEAGGLFGFTDAQQPPAVAQWLSTSYLIAAAFEDNYGKKWDKITKVQLRNIVKGLREGFAALTMSMVEKGKIKPLQVMLDHEKDWKTPVLKDIGKTLYNHVKNSSSTGEMETKLILIESILRHPKIVQHLPQLPRDSRRLFTAAQKDKKYNAQAFCCAWSGEPIQLKNCVAHHIIPYADGGLTTYSNLQMVSKKLHDEFKTQDNYDRSRLLHSKREAVAA